LPFDVANTLASTGECPQVRELRFSANGILLWAIDVDDVKLAHARLCEDMRTQAEAAGVKPFDALVAALQAVLHWTTDEARALALVFTFSEGFAFDRVHVAWDAPRTRGRRHRVNARMRDVLLLGRAWLRLTGLRAGVGSNTLFVAALTAAIPFLRRSRIGPRTLNGVSRLLRRERAKFNSPYFRWIPPRDSGAGFQPAELTGLF
jgi:hypothetical protein